MSKRPSKLRILMTTDTLGGVWMYALELARALAFHNVSVILATMGHAVTPSQRLQARRIPGLVLKESRYRLEWMESPWEDVDRAGQWLLGLERRYRPHIIHLNHYSHGNLPWRAPCLVVGHSCVVSWWWAVHASQPPAVWDTYRERVSTGLRGADQVVAPSRTMLLSLCRHYGPLHNTQVVHNGRTAADYPARRKQPYILSAGRVWDAAKNIPAVAHSAAELPWSVHLAGEVHHPEGGQHALDNVLPLGQLSPKALRHWYGHAAIYALPARYEPFGLSILEAALAGCAPVIGDIPSLRELWQDAACFVPPHDETALRTTLRQLIDDPGYRADVAHRAHHRALHYSAQRMAQGYLQLYQAMLPRSALATPLTLKTSG